MLYYSLYECLLLSVEEAQRLTVDGRAVQGAGMSPYKAVTPAGVACTFGGLFEWVYFWNSSGGW